MEGKFIVFEGPDGSGKTTIINMIESYLKDNNIEHVLTREPGGTKISEKIRGILLEINHKEMCWETEALLYSASRAQLVNQLIKPALESGKLVISDRYVYSSLAYQGYGRELGIDKVSDINEFATGGLSPDAIIFFQVDPVTVLERKNINVIPDRLESEHHSYHQRVYEGYQKILDDNIEKTIVIDATKSVDEVYKKTLEELLKLIGG